MPSEDCLIVFVKLPRPGHVKTRLAERIGAAAAATFYRRLAGGIVERMARALACRVVIAVAPSPEQTQEDTMAAARAWLAQGQVAGRLEFAVQRGGDLGERMRNAFADRFAAGARRVVLMGSDCPDATPEDIEALFAALGGEASADVAIAPCDDGGYWAIALRPDSPAPFDRVAWSTGEVLQRTREQVAATGRALRELCPHVDIDDYESYRRYLDERGIRVWE